MTKGKANSPSEAAQERWWLMHVETGTIGMAVRFYAGDEADHYVSKINGRPVRVPIVEFDTGDAFIVKDSETFVPLTDKEVQTFANLQLMVTNVMEVSARLAAASGVARGMYLAIITQILHTQMQALMGLQEEAKKHGGSDGGRGVRGEETGAGSGEGSGASGAGASSTIAIDPTAASDDKPPTGGT